jgi:hypothetical protein
MDPQAIVRNKMGQRGPMPMLQLVKAGRVMGLAPMRIPRIPAMIPK